LEAEAIKHLPRTHAADLPVKIFEKRGRGDVQRMLWLSIEENDVDLCTYAIRKGARLDEGAPHLMQLLPLHAAALQGRVAIVAQLLKYGVAVNKTDCNLNTALHYAAREGRNDVVESLLMGRATANVRDSFDRTPAHLCAKETGNGHVYSLMNLVDRGRIDVNAKDRFGHTALHTACITGNTFTARWLVDKAGADPHIEDALGKKAGIHLPGGMNQLLGIHDAPMKTKSPSPDRGNKWGNPDANEVMPGGWNNPHLGYESPGPTSPKGLSDRLDGVLGNEKPVELLDPDQADGCKTQ